MNIVRKLCATFVLTITVAFSTFAGEITTMRTQPFPNSQTTLPADLMTEIAFDLLQSALSLI